VLSNEYHAMKAYWGSGGIAPHILHGDEWSASLPGHLIPRERTPRTHWIKAEWAPTLKYTTTVHLNIASSP